MRLHRVEAGEMAQLFHATLSAALADLVQKTVPARSNICLAGGTFLNRFLSTDLTLRLTNLGYRVYLSEQMPCGDGGVSFGQEAVVAERLSSQTI